MKHLLLLLLLVIPLRARAGAEHCTLASSGSWTSATAYSGAVSGCTLSGDDDVEILPGVIATCPSGAAPGDTDVAMTTGAITVDPGATLEIEAGCAIGVPAGGLTVNGTLSLRGKVLSYGTAEPDFSEPALTSAPLGNPHNTLLRVQKIVHCPLLTPQGVVSDCGATAQRQQIALCWPDGDPPAGCPDEAATCCAGGTGCPQPACWGLDSLPGERYHAAWLGRIAPADIAVFWDASNGLMPGRDVNAMYEVSASPASGGAGDRCIFLDVLQGGGDEACDTFDDPQPSFDERSRNCTQVQREIQVCTTDGALKAGDRVVTCGTDAASQRVASFANEHVGRWLTCTDADVDGDGRGDGRWVTSRVTATTDGGAGADTLKILPGGFPFDVPSGTRCFLDFGWMPGDTFSVFRPATLADGDDVVGNGSLLCGGGSCTTSFALLNNRGAIDAAGSTDFDDTWIEEPSNQITTNFIVRLYGSNQTFTRLQVTSTRKNDSHGFAIAGSGSNPKFEDGVLRYGVDDWFVTNPCSESGTTCTGPADNGSDTHYSVNLERERIEFMGGGCNGGTSQPGCVAQPCGTSCGGSGAIFDANLPNSTRPATLTAKDVLCVSCNTPDGTGTYFLDTPGSSGYLDGYVMLGVNGQVQDWDGRNDVAANVLRNFVDIDQTDPFPNSDNLHAVTELSDASIIGFNCLVPGCGLFAWSALRSDWSRVLIRGAQLISPSHLLYLGVFADVGGHWQDVALIDNANGGGATPFYVGAVPGAQQPISIDGLTVANTGSGQTSFAAPWQWAGDDAAFATRRTLRRALFANFASSVGNIAANASVSPGDADGIDTECVYQVSGGLGAGLDIPRTIVDDAMQFVDPGHGIFVPKAGLPSEKLGYRCGARGAGARNSWPLRSLHYYPTLQKEGLTWKAASSSDLGSDLDCDGIPNVSDDCPYYATPDQGDVDGNGRGDACECGDQNGDGTVDVRDLLAIHAQLFKPGTASPLCDTNGDAQCDVLDVVGVSREILSLANTSVCARQPVPGPTPVLELVPADDLSQLVPGRTVAVEVVLEGLRGMQLDGLTADVRFDAGLLGSPVPGAGPIVSSADDFSSIADPGFVEATFSRGPTSAGITHDGVFFRVEFTPLAPGSGVLSLETLAAETAGSDARWTPFVGAALPFSVLPSP